MQKLVPLMLKKSILLASTLTAVYNATPAHAIIVTFADQTSFLNALNGATKFQDAFNDFSFGSQLTQIARSDNGLTVTYTAPPIGMYTGNGNLTTFAFDNLIANFGSGIFAAGGNFFLTDVSGNFQAFPGETISAYASNGIDPISTLSVTTNSTSNFFGWISTTPLTSVTAISGGASPSRWNTIDNFIVATAPSSPEPTPAPGPLPLFGALGALAWSRRLRQSVATGGSSQAL